MNQTSLESRKEVIIHFILSFFQVKFNHFSATTASSKQYILRSTLHPTLIEAASVWDADIEAAEREDIKNLYAKEGDRRPEGTLIAWKHAGSEQLGATGVLHVILALILVNGRVLTDSEHILFLSNICWFNIGFVSSAT